MNFVKKVIVLFVSSLILFSCTDTSTNSKANLKVDAIVKEQAGFGYEMNQIIASGNDVYTTTTGNSQNTSISASVNSALKLKNKAEKLMLKANNNFQKRYSELPLGKITSEDTVWYSDTLLNGNRVREAAFYDSGTKIIRYYYVIYEFSANTPITYDSTQIRYKTDRLLFPTYSQLLDLYNLTEFKSTFLVQTIESGITATSWDNNYDVTSFEAASISTYNSNSSLDRIESAIIYNTDRSGSLTETIYFKDGTTSTSTYTFDANGNGSFTRSFKNGVSVTGEFNIVEDDGEGFYHATTTFASDSYISLIYRGADVFYNAFNSIFSADYLEIIMFSDNSMDSTQISLNINENSGISSLDVTKPNGAYGSFTVKSSDQYAQITGYWITWDNYYIDVLAEYYNDGSCSLTYAVYQNETAFKNGFTPLITASYTFTPGQNGSGTLTYNNKTYDVSLQNNGVGTISSGNAETAVNLYQ